MFSCERENDSSPNQSVNAVPQLIESLPTLPIDQVEVTFKNGIPSYASTDKFSQALRSVSLASEEDYLRWASGKGLYSAYHTYLEAALKVDSSPEIEASQLLSTEESANIVFLSEGGIIPNPTFIASRLSDNEGRLYIGDDIHSFTKDFHHIVDNGTPETLAEAIQYRESVTAEGIVVQKLADVSSFSGLGSARVQVESFLCPNFLLDNINGSNDIGVVRGYWGNYGGQAAIIREDEQRVGCSGSRCRQGTWSAFIVTTLLTELQGRAFRSTSFVNYAFNNRRRSGLNWIRTFPDVLIDNGVNPAPGSMSMATEIVQVNTSNPPTPLTTSEEFIVPVDYPSLFTGTADENPVISEFSILIPYDFINAGVVSFYSIEEGAVRHRWTNRGNNPVNDPISIEYRCQ